VIVVFAHGLVQRSTLPIPQWLFGWAAAAVLCVSFVALAALWPRPRLEHPGWRPLPRGIGRALGSRAVEVVCGAIGVAILGLVLLCGYAGPDTPLGNFAPTFVFIIFWVGLVFASLLFGDVFRAFNPWRAIGRVLFRGRSLRDYPASFGRWPAAVGMLGFTWIELGSGWGEEPATLARGGGLQRADARLHGRLRRRAVVATRRDVLGLLQPVLAAVGVRDAGPWSARARSSPDFPGSTRRRARSRWSSR
jgi:hypothetical protein